MHGRVHDFVVINTIKDGASKPTGNSGGAPVREFVGDWPELKIQPTYEKVLDIGSLDINGSMGGYDYCGAGPRWLDEIGAKEHIGIDIIPGRNVDRVMNAHDLEFKDNCFDLVMCMSMLEHDTDPQSTLNEAFRVLKPGAPFILTTVDETHGEHKHLGGGDTETYNFITEKEFKDWLIKAGFKKDNINILHIESDLMAYCIK